MRDFTVVGSIEEPSIDWGPEEIKYEGPPARGEVVANLAMSWTVVWLPLTIAALGRALWVNYKITDKRVAIMSKSPLRTERTDVPMDQIVDIITVGRGIGLWGDVVITLKNQVRVVNPSQPQALSHPTTCTLLLKVSMTKFNVKVTFRAGARRPTEPTSSAPVRGFVPPCGLSRDIPRLMGRSAGFDSCSRARRDPLDGDRAPVSAKTRSASGVLFGVWGLGAPGPRPATVRAGLRQGVSSPRASKQWRLISLSGGFGCVAA